MRRRKFIAGLLCGTLMTLTVKAGRPRKILMQAQLTPPAQDKVTFFTLNKPASTVTYSTLTDLEGRVSASFTLKSQDRSGLYTGQVDIYIDGIRISDSGSVQI